MKQDFANAPTPTLFDLFLTNTGDAPAIEHKRFVRRLCEAVGATIERKVRFRMVDNAGQTLVNGAPTPVAGFVVFAECSNEGQSWAEDKRALMAEWWTDGGYEQVAPYRVAKVASHAIAVECDLDGDIEDFVTNTLGRTFVKPDVWTKREERAAALAKAEQERQARREARAEAKAKAALAAAKAAAAKAGVSEDAIEQALAEGQTDEGEANEAAQAA